MRDRQTRRETYTQSVRQTERHSETQRDRDRGDKQREKQIDKRRPTGESRKEKDGPTPSDALRTRRTRRNRPKVRKIRDERKKTGRARFSHLPFAEIPLALFFLNVVSISLLADCSVHTHIKRRMRPF
jgi:hypothetical protein